MPRLLKEMMVLGVGAIALLYLVNPTAGFLEFIPDNLPLVGNLDEVGATAILLGALRYYGFDPTRLFVREEPKQLPPPPVTDRLPR